MGVNPIRIIKTGLPVCEACHGLGEVAGCPCSRGRGEAPHLPEVTHAGAWLDPFPTIKCPACEGSGRQPPDLDDPQYEQTAPGSPAEQYEALQYQYRGMGENPPLDGIREDESEEER